MSDTFGHLSFFKKKNIGSLKHLCRCIFVPEITAALAERADKDSQDRFRDAAGRYPPATTSYQIQSIRVTGSV
jgi:hypothetical protein